MPLQIITKNTPERLTFDLSKGCTGSETQQPRSDLVPDTHTEKFDYWLNALQELLQKTHPNGWPLTFTKGAQVWNSAPGISISPWYTYGKIRLLTQCLQELLQKTHQNGWPFTFPKVAQVWNSAPGISLSPWYTHKTDTNRNTHPDSEIIAKSNTEGTELNLLSC